MWGLIPAAGRGSRIQPLAFSKELLPVGSCAQGGRERPCAVSEYLIERMIEGGADRICFIIGSAKSDILEYYGASYADVPLTYVVQPEAAGLCDALFRARHLVHDREQVLVGLPDTIWFPRNGFRVLPDEGLSFLLFPVDRPEHFDAVIRDDSGRVTAIDVKAAQPRSHWIWGAFKMSGAIFAQLHALWLERDRLDEYFGTLAHHWISQGGHAQGIPAGRTYVDVGTFAGYRHAIALLGKNSDLTSARLD